MEIKALIFEHHDTPLIQNPTQAGVAVSALAEIVQTLNKSLLTVPDLHL